ncbi:MAG: hypothetical protein FJ291_11980 [Planctomycetes bacterium]|nr:hypothetical protein [Planctomycetota bacterium]
MKRRRGLALWCLVSACVAPTVAPAGQMAPPPIPQDRFQALVSGPMRGAGEIVFAVRQPGKDGHWYANFGYRCEDEAAYVYGAMGRLCKANLLTGEVTTLLEDTEGAVRDPQVHYDAERIIFSYRKGGERCYHLYEVRADGSGLRQLTGGPYDDIEPTYLPDGGIMFCSSRANRWVNCWDTPVATLYRCDGDGRNIRRLSANIEHDNTPWPLPDGRILHTRWEYVDRNQLWYHHLWATSPDGTMQTVYYGNLLPGGVFIDAKPIAGTSKVALIDSPGHGVIEHRGTAATLSPAFGPDCREALRALPNGANCRDPYPLAEDCILAAQGTRVVLLDGKGGVWTLFELPKPLAEKGAELHEPRPLLRRTREHILPPRTSNDRSTGTVLLVNAYLGRNMDGVKPGAIRKLLILEPLAKPVNFLGLFNGWTEPITFGGSFTLERVLGTVPVEPDGSALFEVPAGIPLFVVAWDEANNSVKRMQSFFTLMPGETLSCVGCHESRAATPPAGAPLAMALRSAPARIEGFDGLPEVFDFPRDIQPLLDRHCVRCHSSQKRDGKVVLEGERSETFSISYAALTLAGQISDGRNREGNKRPYSIGSSASPLLKKVKGEHYDVKVSPREELTLRLWIECGAPYPGTYAALWTGSIDLKQRPWDGIAVWQPFAPAAAAIGKRCLACHSEKAEGNMQLPMSPTHWGLIAGTYAQSEEKERKRCISAHLAYNLTRPERSVMLLAALAASAGGYAGAEKGQHPVVFKDASDPDYQVILAGIRTAQKALEANKRFDMPGFRPNRQYVREMQRFGILPQTLDPARDPVDPYEADRKYWASFRERR